MKRIKLIIIGIVALSVLSCSKSDDKEEVIIQGDLIVGVWKPIKDIEFIGGIEEVYFYSVCEQKSRFTFDLSGELDVQLFYEDENTGVCTPEKQIDFVSASWKKTAPGNYEVSFIYFDDDSQQNITETSFIKVSFPDGSTMIIDDEGYIEEYARVQ